MAFRRVSVSVILFCYLLISSQSLEFRKHHKIEGPIKTIVVVVMENRSFDHILGWLKSTRPEIDGLTGKESNPINVSDPNSERIYVSDDAVFVDMDPGHSFQAIREQIFGSNDTSGDPKMNGFAQQSEAMEPGMAKNVMSGFKPEVLPIYTELANEFGIFDKWFASVPTSTQPNRFYVHSATSHGCQSNVKKDLIKGFPQKTIFDSLEENGLSFGIYYQNIPATFFFKSLRRIKHLVKFHSYSLKFKLHAKLGKLPNYSVVEQRYFDIDLFPANDDHPSHDVAAGQKFVKEVYETLRSSPQWKEMALIITYDEHGGFYDHVPTPVKGVPNPDGIIGPDPFYFGFDRLGVRVPTFLISPWIEKGTVIHEPDGPTPTSQYEHSSIPATVKKLFNLKSPFLTKRDAWAGTFEKYFRIRDSPRQDCPEKLPEVTKPLRPFGAREDSKLSEFQVELIQLASQLVGDHLLNSYPNIGKNMTVSEGNKYVEDAVQKFLEVGMAALEAGADENTKQNSSISYNTFTQIPTMASTLLKINPPPHKPIITASTSPPLPPPQRHRNHLLRRDFLSLATTSTLLPQFLTPGPSYAAENEEYVKDTSEVINKVRNTLSMAKTDPNVADAVAELREASNFWVAKYRKEKALLGKASFRDIYSALNAVSGHYVSFGPTAPIPAKRKARILEEMETAEKALSRGR